MAANDFYTDKLADENGIVTVRDTGTVDSKNNRIGAKQVDIAGNLGAGEYEAVAASTVSKLGATGAVGDYLEGLLVIPATTSPGEISIADGGTSFVVFVGGADSLSNLVPFFIPLGIKAVQVASPGWEVTTGSDLSVIAVGNFT